MNKRPPIKIVLIKKYATDTEGYLSLRVGIPGTKRYNYRSLNYKIEEKLWDAKGERVLKGHPKSGDINIDIQNQKSKLEIDINNDKLQGKQFTKEFIAQKMKKTNATDFFSFFDEYLQFMKKERKGRDGSRTKHSPNTIRKWEGYFNTIYDYTNGKLIFEDITAKWLERLDVHASKTMSVDTSLPVFMAKVKQVLKRADQHGLFNMRQVLGYSWPKYVDPSRPFLTLEQTETLANKIYKKEIKKPDVVKVIAFFLVECWSGLRFSDWKRFQVRGILKNKAIMVRAKKNGEPVYVPLHKSPRLSEVIKFIGDNDIVFDLSERKANEILKNVADIMDWEIELTTHVGRHTCATLLLMMGYSKGRIADWLGISERTVEIYAKQIRIDLQNDYERLGGI